MSQPNSQPKLTQSAKEIFLAAIEKVDPADRVAFLCQACGDDTDLRQHVDALLQVHDQPDSLLDQERIEACVLTDPPLQLVGTQIGPYKLLQEIGQGGMGVVYMAEQLEPVRRNVALKIIKPGMDSRQVIARFEAERQALALMDHSHIARVFDAGATESGRPYFVMELVRGIPITEYCDQCGLTTGERLELFIGVCQAVQHAHQKGIIHRDIKPNNVMVVIQDGRAAPKVIDFGVAKAINQPLSEQAIQTGFAQLIGTPLYMSPEQAELSALDVDTRSDIYSLGVLLYELLTGGTPFLPERLRGASFDDLRRIIREEEPPLPSARISTLDAAFASTVADRQRTDARRLVHTVRGDLDWIVMKCLEKDRTRRYDTVGALVKDIQRYLADEPIEARPPSATVRLRKFARRNTAGFAAAIGLSLAVLLALIGLIVNNRLVTREKEQKEIALTRAVQEQQRADENLARAREAVKQYLLKTSQSPLLQSGDFQHLRTQLMETAIPFYEEFVGQQQDDPELEAERGRAFEDLAFLRQETGDLVRALGEFEKAQVVFRRLSETFPEQPGYRQRLAETLDSRGNVLHQLGKLDEAELAYRQAMEGLSRLVAEHAGAPQYRDSLARTSGHLGVLLNDARRTDEADTMLRQAITIREQLISEQPGAHELSGQLAQTHLNLGTILYAQRRMEDAEQAFRKALEVLDRSTPVKPTSGSIMPPNDQQLRAQSLNNLGMVYRAGDRLTDAENAYRQALAIKKQLADTFPSVPQFGQELARSFSNLGVVLLALEKSDAAHDALQQSIDIYERLAANFRDVPEYEVELAGTYSNLGRLLGDQGQLEQSILTLTKSIELLEAAFDRDPRLAKVRESLCVAHWTRAMTLAGMRQFSAALADWDRALELDDGRYQTTLRLKRASNLLNLNEHARATADATAIAESSSSTAEELYNAACVYAISTGLAAEDEPRADAYAARAVLLLRQAHANGFTDAEHLKSDADLEILRTREDFQQFMMELEREATKLKNQG